MLCPGREQPSACCGNNCVLKELEGGKRRNSVNVPDSHLTVRCSLGCVTPGKNFVLLRVARWLLIVLPRKQQFYFVNFMGMAQRLHGARSRQTGVMV